MGSLSKEDSFKLLDAFVDRGGNFIDTANNYQDEESEIWIGEWVKARGNRDQLVIATKFTTQYRAYELGKVIKASNYQGNGRKSLHVSLKDSLRKLQTDYIDLLYLHWWDFTTSIPEIMDSLDNLVKSGKVLYLGVSDTPAWIVSAANTYATSHGKTPFSVYQGKWSILDRDFERDIIPMARHFQMALCPWNVMGGGKLKTAAQIEARKKEHGKATRSMMGTSEQSELEVKMSAALEKVAKEVGVESITAVAIAYVMQKAQYVFPIVGGSKVEYLDQNIEALDIHLSDEQVEFLESQSEFDIGFPNTMIGPDPHTTKPGVMNAGQAAHVQWQQDGKPIGHRV
jgi:aryl-alcohol dehydrogenase-like predicted oxidoreductase